MLRMVTTELAGRSGGLWTDQLIRPGRYAMLKKGRGNVVAAKEFASALITLLTAIEEVRIRPAQATTTPRASFLLTPLFVDTPCSTAAHGGYDQGDLRSEGSGKGDMTRGMAVWPWVL